MLNWICHPAVPNCQSHLSVCEFIKQHIYFVRSMYIALFLQADWLNMRQIKHLWHGIFIYEFFMYKYFMQWKVESYICYDWKV